MAVVWKKLVFSDAVDYGLSFEGIVTTATSDVQFSASALAGKGDGYFKGYYAYPIWDAGGAGAAPQGEHQLISAYTSIGGVFVHTAFTADLALTDKILIVHPAIAQILDMVDDIWDEAITGATHNIATSAGRRLRQAADVLIAREETCQAGGSNDEVIFDEGASAVDDFYKHDIVILISGTGVGQSRHIDSYVGATKTATINRDWTTNPDATTGYIIRFDSTKHIHHLEDVALAQITGKMLFTMDFWSASLEEVSLDGDTAATKTLPTVTVADLPANAAIVHAVVMFKFRMVENTHATIANKLDGATVATTSQVIQIDKSGATFIDAINFVDDQFSIAAATREGGDVIVGNIDVASEVDANDTYELRWLLALADEDYLNFNDVQVGLRIWYSV